MNDRAKKIVEDFNEKAKHSDKTLLEMAIDEIILLEDAYDSLKFDSDINSTDKKKYYEGAEEPYLRVNFDDDTVNKFPISSKNKNILKRYRDLGYDKDKLAEELGIKPNSAYRRIKRIENQIDSFKK